MISAAMTHILSHDTQMTGSTGMHFFLLILRKTLCIYFVSWRGLTFYNLHFSHGTRCAGEVSGARDNGVCGVGVAYDSMVAGIRMLDQPYMTDLIEANSMGHEPNLIDIYSASWGPTDDGRTVDGPRNATMRAIVRGVNEVIK